jgi:hypothetical protein
LYRNLTSGVVSFLFLLPAAVWGQTVFTSKSALQADEQPTPQPARDGAASQTGAVIQSEPHKPPPSTPPQTGADQKKNKSGQSGQKDKSDQKTDDPEGKQTQRMFWIVPNFSAVNARAVLPPQSTREKFKMATQDSVDYSSFVWAGILAGQSMALNSYPELHQGMAGYGRYYWRAFADQASGAYFTEAIVPTITHEDPRYYTRGYGGFFRRTGYALAQVVVTRTDTAGGRSFNYSEVVGAGLEAGLSNAYYPAEERGLVSTAKNWGTQLESAALNNVVREFWPDIRRKVFRQK